jgi:hypothetical protein
MRILIAEDDHTSRTVLAGVLKKRSRGGSDGKRGRGLANFKAT